VRVAGLRWALPILQAVGNLKRLRQWDDLRGETTRCANRIHAQLRKGFANGRLGVCSAKCIAVEPEWSIMVMPTIAMGVQFRGGVKRQVFGRTSLGADCGRHVQLAGVGHRHGVARADFALSRSVGRTLRAGNGLSI